MNKNSILVTFFIIFLTSCSLSPGIYLKSDSNVNGNNIVYLDEAKTIKIPVIDVNYDMINKLEKKTPKAYKIGIGDGVVITVWGYPDIFPMNVVNYDQNLRVVNTDGTIFFPYVGTLNVLGKTQVEVRNMLTKGLSKFFNDPQLDVSISKYNSQRIYLLGEVTMPKKINLTETPLSLTDALGEALGLRTETSEAREVYIIRSMSNSNEPVVYRADLSKPSGFIVASNFYLESQDIIYVNAKGTTRWNKVISQFFPFSSLLNSVDNLVTD